MCKCVSFRQAWAAGPACARATPASRPLSLLRALLALQAHRGFLSRSEGVPVEALFLHALRQGQRLVLCGERTWGL